MYMFLTLLFAGLAVAAVACIMAFGLTPQEREAAEARPALSPEQKLGLQTPQFFVAGTSELPARPQVPVEVLLSQIQRHVQLEQAAAESFVSGPSTESLRSRTTSPFVN